MPDNKAIPVSELRAIIVAPYVRDREERLKLFRFLAQRQARKVVFIGHSPSTTIARRSMLIICERGICRKLVLPRWKELGYLSYLVDLLITMCFLVRARSRYDIYFGSGVGFTTPGLLLRRLKMVKRVVFWTSDYFPDYAAATNSNRFIKRVYNSLHKSCATSSDYLWDVSPAIMAARQDRGIRVKEERVIVVPYMLSRDEIEALPVEEISKYGIMQAGSPVSDACFELILEALALVATSISQVKLSIISYEAFPEAWREKIREHGLGNNVDILGYIEDEAEISRIVQRQRVGLAIYEPESFKKYGDPARVKTYIAKGVPVIMTRVALVWKAVASRKAGIAIDFSQEELAKAILRLFTDDQFYKECREGAIKLASEYEAEAVFREALQRMNILA